MRRGATECTLMDHSFRASSTLRRTGSLKTLSWTWSTRLTRTCTHALVTLSDTWLLVLDCAPQHVAKEFRSIMRDTRPHIKVCHVWRNFTAYTQPLDRAYMRAFRNSIRSEVAKHFAEFFSDAESNSERANLDSSTPVLRQLLLSHSSTERRQPATSNCWLALHRLERGGAA